MAAPSLAFLSPQSRLRLFARFFFGVSLGYSPGAPQTSKKHLQSRNFSPRKTPLRRKRPKGREKKRIP